MGENSAIAWTDDTFNPWIGCQKVSAACDNCYAESWDARWKGERWGPHADRTRTALANWRKPSQWDKKAVEAGKRRRVFCASLADVFDNHKSINPVWRTHLWLTIKDTPNLDWLLLTKRPQNIDRYLPADWGPGYPNVWLGTTVENQQEADRRIPHLLGVPARVHFLSCEPLLGAVDISDWLDGPQTLKWIIAGGESGASYRPASIDWFRFLRDQCTAHFVPFLFKQHEGKTRKEITAKGRELDGVVWNQFPEVSL